jgi:anti-anti-sigma regulatory factor
VPERGDWTQSAPFYLECATAIENRCEVVVDLSDCAQLDSTFLGTVNELCALADAADVGFRLQGVNLRIEGLFAELGMKRVMDHIVAVLLPLPGDMQPILSADLDASTRALLLLRAHEGLASLNAKNREEFGPLVNRLRDELGELARESTVVSSRRAGN